MAIRRIGLTGGIGSGKSTVAALLAAKGATLVDTDAIARSLTEAGGAAMPAVRLEFGEQLVDPLGALDRQRMRELAFADASAKRRLEAILHPLIRAAAVREVAGWRGPYGILVVPLLFERGGGLAGVVQRVLVVDCPEEEQVRRVMARSGLAETEARAIMATQLSRAARLSRADDVLDNSGPPDAIAPKVADLDRRYRALASCTG
jgi:dephospho-CoA kinase